MISWASEFHNSVFNVNFTLQVRVYESLSGFRGMHLREVGRRAPDRLDAMAGAVAIDDKHVLFTMDFHEPHLGAGLVAHESLHVALDVFRMLTGKDEVELKVGMGTGNYDLLGFEAYISEPEECLCDIVQVIVSDFWNMWNEKTLKRS